jgi:3-hydroxyacyl-CoA dehydrogenase/enoyl-CoA hydratase/3-hydroxybutyryl-CoA epimerase
VLRATKPSGFAAGADVDEFRGIDDSEDILRRLSRAHDIVDRLAGLAIPTVAVIHGLCLGGGLELALACDSRIAVDGATLGFPEVMPGLHPGLGGSQRSTALIDPREAMRMMLTGRSVPAPRARRLGLVDTVVAERHVAAAVEAALAGTLRHRRRSLVATALSTAPLRKVVAGRMRKMTTARAAETHYPAPYALIDLWERHGGNAEVMRREEAASFGRLLGGETAQNLIRVFFLREALKGLAKGEDDFEHVHVIGAGTMGGDIAAWCALQGLTVTLTDRDRQALAAALGRATALFRRRLRSGVERRDAFDRLIPDFAGDGVGRADLVIEAVPERIDIKHKVYEVVEPRLKDGAILATNTSSIPLEVLGQGLEKPERLVGLHFFNPVDRMQLVEVVRHPRLDEAVLSKALAFAGRIDRLPAPVASAPGFLVNRVLTPYLLEAMVILDEGVEAAAIDAAAKHFGMAMGPVEVADRIGLDICLHVADQLRDALGEALPEVPTWLRDKVARGELGLKSGKGIYAYRDGKPKRSGGAPEADEGMAERLILPLVNACVACLREGVMEDADLIDASVVFATGFAPFRGGPLHYARERGVDEVVERLERMAQGRGPRFAPDPGWQMLAEKA